MASESVLKLTNRLSESRSPYVRPWFSATGSIADMHCHHVGTWSYEQSGGMADVGC